MSLVDKSGFQETAIGWFSNDWLQTSLGNVCSGRLQTGPFGSQLHSSEYQNEGIPVLMPKDLLGFRANTKSAAKISPERADELARHKLKSGDLLFSRRGDVTKFALIDSHSEGSLCGTGCLKATPSDGVIPEFLAHLIQLDAVRDWLQQNAVGQTMPNMNTGILAALPLALPPEKLEQQKIAAILTTVDDKLDVIARQIEATKNLKQGLMQTMFSRGVGTQDTDGRWVPHTEFKESELGKIPAGWSIAPLGELLEKLMDFRGRTPKKLGMDWGEGGIPALSANNVRMGYIDFDKECYLGSEELYTKWMVQGDTRKNDLVFTMEAPLGNIAVIPDDRKYILSQRVVLLRTNQRVNHRFFFQYLRSDSFQKILETNSTGTTAKGIQQKRLVQLPVVVPPPKEQERIADILGAIDDKLEILFSKQSHHQTLKRGLMQKLLTGEWRVRVEASASET